MTTDNKLLLKGVTLVYPRLDRTYRFDEGENKTVPCKATDDGATYGTRFSFSEHEAKALYKKMLPFWLEHKKSTWPEKLPRPFDVEEDANGNDMYIGRTQLKGAYDGEKTNPPRIFDANNVLISKEDFILTGGSTVNLGVTMVAFKMPTAYGVSLRINAVQVLKLAPMTITSPFDVEEGYDQNADEDGEGSPFGVGSDTDDDDDDMPEPEETAAAKKKRVAAEKRAAKKAEAEAALAEAADEGDDDDEPVVTKGKQKAAATSGGLDSVIDEWDD